MGVAAAEARHRNRRAGASTERGARRAVREGSRGAAADGRVELDEVDEEEAVVVVGRRGKRADLGDAVAEPQGVLIVLIALGWNAIAVL